MTPYERQYFERSNHEWEPAVFADKLGALAPWVQLASIPTSAACWRTSAMALVFQVRDWSSVCFDLAYQARSKTGTSIGSSQSWSSVKLSGLTGYEASRTSPPVPLIPLDNHGSHSLLSWTLLTPADFLRRRDV